MFPSTRSSICGRGLYFHLTLLILHCHSFAVSNEIRVRDTVPAPIVVDSSQDWDGNDGPWSSFALQIGTPPQNVKVFISTAGAQTWAVAEEGCTSEDPSNCFDLRGRLYNYSASSSWEPNLSNITSYIYPLDLEAGLGYNGNGRYGFDNITLGWQGSGGPSLKNQTLAGIAAKDFYLGIFGLTARPSNFTSFNDPIPSYMENLRSENLIPSTSWAYTAGNQYRLNNVLGSLTLGGYDISKFVPNDLTIAFSQQDNRDLVVQVQKIVIPGATPTSLLPTPIPAFIDSTVPYIWLPKSACSLFESAFGLVWDESTELYLLNETQQTALQTQNASITFSIGNLTSSTTVDITFPYSAFELTAAYPLVENSTKYFPLKRADNETQYTLGRTFFQEAYVITDYERKNFSISACKYDLLEPQTIVAILPPSNVTNSSSATSSTATGSSTPLPKAAIGGIAAGGAVVAIAVAALVTFCLRHKKKVRPADTTDKSAYQEMILKPELDGTAKEPEVFETDGRKYVAPAVMKVGEAEIEPMYEMPAREEVRAELMSTERVEIGSRGSTPGPTPSSSPSPRKMRVVMKKRVGDDVVGLGRGTSGSSGQSTVSPALSPRSLTSSAVVSPASEGERTYRPYRPPAS